MVSYIIYKICCDDCDYVYVGSTQNFTRRKQQHKINSIGKNEKCQLKIYKTIDEYGGWENWRMVPVEECDESIQTRRQAEMREEEWRLKLNATLNSQRAFRSEEEKKEDKKEKCKEWMKNNEEHAKLQQKTYRKENAEKVKGQKADFYEKHKEDIRACQTTYREENRDKINEQKREHYKENKKELLQKMATYREENKEQISEKKKLKVKCSCGTIFRKEDKARHI